MKLNTSHENNHVRDLYTQRTSFARDVRRETSESCSIFSSRACRALATFRNARVELGEQLQLSKLNSKRALIILDLARNIIPLLQGACPQAT